MLVSVGLIRSLPPRTHRTPALGALAVLAALIAAALAAAVWLQQPLANGPQEWQWAYRPPGLASGGLALALAALGFVLLLAVLAWPAAGGAGFAAAAAPVRGRAGDGRALDLEDAPAAPARGKAFRGLAPPLMAAAGIAFTCGLVAAQPGGFGRVLDSLVSRHSFGFVWDAGLAPDRRTLLADYPAASQGLNQHSVTHPPGPLLAVRALDRLVSRLAPPVPAGAPDTPSRGLANGQQPPGAPAKGLANGQEPPGASPQGLAPGQEPRAAPPQRLASGGEPAGATLAERAAWALDRARARAANRRQPVPACLPGVWTVVVLALLLPALSALAAWPLFHLALACGLGRSGALLAGALWVLVPARSLFTPSLDQALPLLLVTAAWLAAATRPAPAAAPAAGGRIASLPLGWASGAGVWSGLWRAAGAGFLLWCACFLSYGCLAALPLLCALILGAAAGADAGFSRVGFSRVWPPLLRIAALVGVGMLLPWGALALFAGHDPWHAFRAAIELHHKIAVAPRSYATWLMFNPYDFMLLLGPPAFLLAAAALKTPTLGAPEPPATRETTEALATPTTLEIPTALEIPAPPATPARTATTAVSTLSAARRPALTLLTWAFWAVMTALWLSGSVRGEVGRIWLPWMPFACLLAAGAAERWLAYGAGGAETAAWRWQVSVLLLAQAALALTLAANMVFVS